MEKKRLGKGRRGDNKERISLVKRKTRLFQRITIEDWEMKGEQNTDNGRM